MSEEIHPDSRTGSIAGSSSSLDPTPRWLRGLGGLGGVVLGAVLLVAAWSKMLAPDSFVEQIQLEKLDFLLPAVVVAFIALGLEIGLGVALVLGVRRWWILLPSVLLVAFFLFLTGRSYWLDAHGGLPEGVGCGCFGNLVERTPAEAFWQDLLLMVPSLLLAFVGRGRGRGGRRSSKSEFPRLRVVLIAVVVVAGLIFAWRAPNLPLDNLATRLKPGVNTANLCSGRDAQQVCLDLIIPELNSGEHWVVLTDLDEEFSAAVPALNEHLFEQFEPRIWALVAVESETLTAFTWSTGPAFEVREAPPALLRSLYRRLPRSFLVKDGKVTATYDGLPPLPGVQAGSP